MPTVTVKGVGDIDLPDGLSQDQMTQAINSHPDVQTYMAQQPTSTVGKALKSVLGPVNDYIRDNNFLGMETAKNVSREVAKGIPVAGAYTGGLTPQDENSNQQFEADNPVVSKGLNTAGSIASALPVTGGLTALSGGSKVLNAGLQALNGATTNALDTKARGGSSEDSRNAALLGALGGTLVPAGVGKAASPGLSVSQDAAKLISTIGGTVAGLGATFKGGLAHGLDPVVGLLLGENNKVSTMLRSYLNNTAAQSPKAQAVLQALGTGGSQQVPPNVANALPRVPFGE